MSHALPRTSEPAGLLDELQARNCPVCGSGHHHAALFLESSIDATRMTGTSFASRKAPEYMSYRLLRCGVCDTVYAGAIPATEHLADAYSEAEYDSSEEAALAADTYARALAPVIDRLPRKERALEIGTGTGVLLPKLLAAGFSEVIGVEPSRAAIAAADPSVRGFIREGIFVESDYAAESIDLICCFQTLEHVPYPEQLVLSCAHLLRPGGVLALVTHDYKAPINRLLGRRSPIIDIEHMQLFCRSSLGRILGDAALTVTEMRTLSNRYPVRYWVRLIPLPARAKGLANGFLAATGLEGVQIGINVGNLFVAARK